MLGYCILPLHWISLLLKRNIGPQGGYLVHARLLEHQTVYSSSLCPIYQVTAYSSLPSSILSDYVA